MHIVKKKSIPILEKAYFWNQFYIPLLTQEPIHFNWYAIYSFTNYTRQIYIYIFELCNKNCFLKQTYTRSQLEPFKEIVLDLKTLFKSSKKEEITLQEVACCNSLMCTQDYQICHCQMKTCKTNKSISRVVGKLYNSKCHSFLRVEINSIIIIINNQFLSNWIICTKIQIQWTSLTNIVWN